MSIVVTIEGFDKVYQILNAPKLIDEVDRALVRAAGYTRDIVKQMPPVNAERTGYGAKGIPVAPKYGGTLRGSISSRKVGLLAAEVFIGPAAQNYGMYVHDGTKKMPARPFGKWALEDFHAQAVIETVVKGTIERFMSV